jgi:RNA polymerase sigma-70 factor (sigma-E family)
MRQPFGVPVRLVGVSGAAVDPKAVDDGDLLSRVYAEQFPSIVRMAWALCGDPGVAEELTQEAFVRLYLRRRALRDPAAAPAYLRRTVANLAIDRGRRRGRRPEQTLDPAGEMPPPGAAPRPASAGLDLDLLDALDRLPGRRRACVVLRYYLDLSEADTAAALGISVGTVKSQTHKALGQLRDYLRDDIAPSGTTGVSASGGKEG